MLEFKNKQYIKIEKDYLDSFQKDPSCLPTVVKIQDLHHVYFELSNICNYSGIHPRCPVSLQTTKKVLSSKVIKNVIKELGENNFQGYIAFHRYNEPFNDPRLFELISYAKNYSPPAKIRLLTNGSYLTQTITDALAELNIYMLEVSAYFEKEYQRLKNLKPRFPYKVFFARLDARNSLYDSRKLNLKKPCFAPIRDVTINCQGRLSLCCLDWKNQHLFGDLNQKSLKKIIGSRFFQKTYQDLSQGKRTLNLCSRCDWQR